jgi:hypothetical protein
VISLVVYPRLLELGYAKDVYKLDFAALYPKIEITHGIFPNLDISGVMEGTLYVVDTVIILSFLQVQKKIFIKLKKS